MRGRSASVRSRPSATSVSNSGGVAVRPVTATRMAMNRSPAFQPRSSARARSGGSSSSASKATSPTSAIVVAGGRQALERGRRVPALGHERRRVELDVVDPQEADQVADRAERRQPLLDDGQQRAQLVVGRHPVDPAGGELGLDERPERSISSSASRRRIHWPLSHSSRSRSNTAPPLWTSRDVEALDELVEREDLLLGARSTSRAARGS